MFFRKKRKITTNPFDRNRIPPKQNPFFVPFIWLLCWACTRKGKLKIHKEQMEGLKPPFLVLGTHQAFMDFCVTPLALFPYRANYISELEGFEYYGEWFYRQLGCLGTRKFVSDLALVRNIRRVVERKGIIVIYPEARYANVGTNSEIPISVAKLAKMLDVPLVTINMKGNYLRSPIWNLTVRNEARLDATIKQLFTREEVKSLTLQEIIKGVQKELAFDEYAWQRETKQAITYTNRAEGLHKVLYQCPVCMQEFQMQSEGSRIFCKNCSANWEMTEYGKLKPLNSRTAPSEMERIDFTHIPNWYEWERGQVQKEIDNGRYCLEISVHIESLPNAVNFIDLGNGRLLHNEKGFFLTFTDYGEIEEKTLPFPAASMLSIHTEYDYRGKGQCVTLSTLDNTYFIYPNEPGFNSTKIQFAVEYLHKLHTSSMKNQKAGAITR